MPSSAAPLAAARRLPTCWIARAARSTAAKYGCHAGSASGSGARVIGSALARAPSRSLRAMASIIVRVAAYLTCIRCCAACTAAVS